MNANRIEFTFDEMPALTKLIRGLNEQGVPYKLVKDAHAIAIIIENGF